MGSADVGLTVFQGVTAVESVTGGASDTLLHHSDCLRIVYPPTITSFQGLALVHYSA